MGKLPRGAWGTSCCCRSNSPLPGVVATALGRTWSRIRNPWATAAPHLRGTLPIDLMTLACPVPWAIINAGARAAMVAVSFASGGSDDLVRALRNPLPLLMRKLKLIDDEFGT